MGKDNEYLSVDFLEEQQIYEMIVYLPVNDLKLNDGTTVNDILQDVSKLQALSDSEQDILKGIQSIINNNKDLGNCTIGDMSWNDNNGDGKPDHPANGMQACTFTNPKTGDTFVTFRGTPAGSWVDNAKMLLGILKHCRSAKDLNGNEWRYTSPMQAEAVGYMNSLIEQYGNDWLADEQKRYLIGHSKGGSQVQLIMMMYSDYFDAGLSMDGQGISKELYEEMVRNLGEKKIQQALAKLYGLNGSNDYVHRLGLQLILPENTRWFVEYQYGTSIEGNHFGHAFVNIETGELAAFAEGPGPLANFMGKASEIAMDLPPKEREAVFMTLMLFLQLLYAQELPVNPLDERWLSLYANLDDGSMQAFGIILSLLVETEEGAALIEYLREEGVVDGLEDFKGELTEWYKSQPLDIKARLAQGVACVLVMVVTLLSAISKTMDMAGNLQFIVDSANLFAELGTALVKAYIRMVQEVIAGFLRGCTLLGKTVAKGIKAMGQWFAGEQTAESGKIGIHYENVKIVAEMITQANQLYYQAVYVKLQNTLDTLHSMKYWRVDVVPLMLCMDSMEQSNRKVFEYRNYLELHAGDQQKLEREFMEKLGKNK